MTYTRTTIPTRRHPLKRWGIRIRRNLFRTVL